MDQSLAGKIAIVTGATRGIGRAIAERLAGAGASVVVGYATKAALAEVVVNGIVADGGRAIAVHADVARENDIRRLFHVAIDRLGPPDIVVANAGILTSGPVADATPADFDACFGVNARGTFLTLVEAARSVADGGRIIAISTNLTLQPFPGYALYAGSKAAVEQFVRVLAREVAARGITVNAVAPGPTDTDMLPEAARAGAAATIPLGRLGRPADIADVVAFLASEQARWITGQVLGANGGMV
jgi:3-oxoacyl-[acyl-carrier protein] reductase